MRTWRCLQMFISVNILILYIFLVKMHLNSCISALYLLEELMGCYIMQYKCHLSHRDVACRLQPGMITPSDRGAIKFSNAPCAIVGSPSAASRMLRLFCTTACLPEEGSDGADCEQTPSFFLIPSGCFDISLTRRMSGQKSLEYMVLGPCYFCGGVHRMR